MNLNINDQELQDKAGKQKLIFKGENGALYEIIPYDGRSDDTELPEQ